jgi:hypothetical protein
MFVSIRERICQNYSILYEPILSYKHEKYISDDPSPEPASKLYRPPLVGDISANFCG